MKGIKNENGSKKSLHGIRRNGIRRNGIRQNGIRRNGKTPLIMCGFNSKMIHFELLDSFDRQKFKFCKSKMAADAILKIEK